MSNELFSNYFRSVSAVGKLRRTLADFDKDLLTEVDKLDYKLAIGYARKLRPRKPRLVDGLTVEEVELARQQDGKIPAIKKVRERTGKGLKEAKDIVENWMQKHLGYTYYRETEQYPAPQQY